jgi:hypothetical protein
LARNLAGVGRGEEVIVPGTLALRSCEIFSEAPDPANEHWKRKDVLYSQHDDRRHNFGFPANYVLHGYL